MVVLNQVTPITIPDLQAATTLTGNELVPISQANAAVNVAIAALPQGMTAGVVTYGGTSVVFPNARTLSAGSGIEITDGGAGGDLKISTTGGTVSGVSSVNGIYGAVTLAAGTNVTISSLGSTLTFNATGGGSSTFNSITSGTNTTAAMVVGTGASLSATGSGSIDATSVSTISGLIAAGTNISISGSGTSKSPYSISASGSVGASFDSITSGTNTTATMVISTGASLAPSGSGVITATVAPAGTLTGTTLNSTVVTSSLTSVGTIGTGVWQGTKIGVVYGGTGSDLSATGGTSQVLQQTTKGAVVTVGQLGFSSLSGSATVAQLPSNSVKRVISATFDGQGSALTAPKTLYLSNIPYSGTITGVTMLADQTGTAVVDIWKTTYAGAPPTISNTITKSAIPTLGGAQKSQDNTLTGWTTTITAGDTMAFNLSSASTITELSLTLQVDIT